MEATADSQGAPLRWSVEHRLRFIDARLFWDGRINRADLMRAFAISVPQASADLGRYQTMAPGNIAYDTRARVYLATADFSPLFAVPPAEAELARLGAGADVPVGTVPAPSRTVDPWLLRRMLGAIRGRRSLHVLYQSLGRPEPGWRWITPAALATDGTRWHVRAFCRREQSWRDFLFPRIADAGDERPDPPPPSDPDWARELVIRLVPAPRLTPGPRRAVARDYGMTDGEARLPVRAALLFYAWRRLGLDRSDSLVDAANRAELEAELARVGPPARPG